MGKHTHHHRWSENVTYESLDRHDCPRTVAQVPKTRADTSRRSLHIQPILLVHRRPNVLLQILGSDLDVHGIGHLHRLSLNGGDDAFRILLSSCTWSRCLRSPRSVRRRVLLLDRGGGLSSSPIRLAGICVGGRLGSRGWRGLGENLLAELLNNLQSSFAVDLRPTLALLKDCGTAN